MLKWKGVSSAVCDVTLWIKNNWEFGPEAATDGSNSAPRLLWLSSFIFIWRPPNVWTENPFPCFRSSITAHAKMICHRLFLSFTFIQTLVLKKLISLWWGYVTLACYGRGTPLIFMKLGRSWAWNNGAGAGLQCIQTCPVKTDKCIKTMLTSVFSPFTDH